MRRVNVYVEPSKLELELPNGQVLVLRADLDIISSSFRVQVVKAPDLFLVSRESVWLAVSCSSAWFYSMETQPFETLNSFSRVEAAPLGRFLCQEAKQMHNAKLVRSGLPHKAPRCSDG